MGICGEKDLGFSYSFGRIASPPPSRQLTGYDVEPVTQKGLVKRPKDWRR